jgi:hypothetical protein
MTVIRQEDFITSDTSTAQSKRTTGCFLKQNCQVAGDTS